MQRCLTTILFSASLTLAASAAAAEQDLAEMSAGQAARAIASGDTTSAALVETLLERIAAAKSGNAFIAIDAQGAREGARDADAAMARGEAAGPLHGVPIVIKDNIATSGLATTAGTPALKGWTPETDAPVVARLRAAGALVLGKTNLHELAFGITSNNAGFGAVANAYDPSRFAGGSSGGTAAAIGGRLAPAGLGTDTGGSARIPAALNGIAGFRPSSGRYPQAGIVPISHTRDTAGPMARTVADIVLLDGIITETPTALEPALPAGIRIGVPAAFHTDLDPETRRLTQAALDAMEAAGVTLVPLDMAAVTELNNRIGFPIALWEAKRDLAAFLAEHGTDRDLAAVADEIASPDVRFVFDELILGDKAIPDAVYQDAIGNGRPRLQALYAETFARHDLDAIAFPTTPLPAQPIEGSDETVMLNGKPAPTFPTFIRNTDPGSNAGIPGISLPAGLTRDGLPVGLELDGPAFSDRHLLAIALAVEAMLPATPAPR